MWKDKYSTILYNPLTNLKRYEIQPLPDIERWFKCHELHYMPYQEVALLEHGQWDEIPGLFLPSKVLDLCYMAIPKPPQDIAKLIALLAWTTPSEAKEYYSRLDDQVVRILEADQQREKWKHHPLYKHTKPELEKMCRSLKLPVSPSLTKHQLVTLIANSKGEKEPDNSGVALYSGRLLNVPTTVKKINQLPVAKLREILHFHKLPLLGTKDQLSLRVYLLKHCQPAAVTAKEEEQIKDLVKIFKFLAFAQRKLQLSSHAYQKRTFTSKCHQAEFVSPPQRISITNSHELFDPLVEHLDNMRQARKDSDSSQSSTTSYTTNPPPTSEVSQEEMKQVGAKVKIKWTADEIGDSGWRCGWYVAYVQAYDEETDNLTLEYLSEPGAIYIVDLTKYIHMEKIELVKAVL